MGILTYRIDESRARAKSMLDEVEKLTSTKVKVLHEIMITEKRLAEELDRNDGSEVKDERL